MKTLKKDANEIVDKINRKKESKILIDEQIFCLAEILVDQILQTISENTARNNSSLD